MTRVDFHLTARQIEWLRSRSAETGLPVAELIRRLLDEAMKKQGKAGKERR